jgi:hypothetical protein
VDGSLVDTVSLGLLGLHLQTTTDSVKGVRDVTRHDDGELRTGPFGRNANESRVLVVRVETLDGVVETELDSTVWNDSSDRDSESLVERKDSLGAVGSLDETVPQTSELTFSRTNIY